MAVRTSINKDDGYHVESLHVDEKGGPLPLHDDPDVGLSPEERQKRVWYHLESWTLSILTLERIGSPTTVEARPQPHPLAVSLISDFVPGSDKYWQCKGRRSTEGPQNDQWAMERLAGHLLRVLLRL